MNSIFKKYSKKEDLVATSKHSLQNIFEIKVPLKKLIITSVILFLSGFAISWVFYKLILFSVFLGLSSISLIKLYIKKYKRKINETIEEEFYDINLLLSAELETGIPVSTAINSIRREISNSDIYDFEYMNIEIANWSKKMNMGIKINAVIENFALRSQNKNIIEYSNLISICTKRGGNIRDVIKNTNTILNDKRELKRDIEVLTTEKRLEQKIMNLMPIAVLVMLDKSAPEFISPLYTSIMGRITMTILMFIFLICYLWSSKITRLE